MESPVQAPFEQGTGEEPLDQGMALDYHGIVLNRCIDTHLEKHPEDGLPPVALLVGKPSHTANPAGTLAECGEHRKDREKVRTVGGIGGKAAQRGTLDCNDTLVVIILRKTGPCIHQYIHDAQVGLDGRYVKTGKGGMAEHRTGDKEIGSGAPVAFQGE